MSTTPPPFSKPLDYYTGLITSEYRSNVAPKFNAWLTANLNMFQDCAACASSMLSAFDLNTAVGVQLDAVGVIIGRSRTLPFQPSPVVESVTLFTATRGFCMAYAGTSLWVTNPSNGTVTKTDPNTGSTLQTVNVGGNPGEILYDGANLWITDSNTVIKVNESSGTIVGTTTVGNGPYALCFDGTNVWVVNGSDSSLSKVTASTGVVAATYTLGVIPFGICFDGSHIWLCSIPNLLKIDPSSGSVLATYTMPSRPECIAFDGTNLWVNADSNRLLKIDPSSGAILNTYAVSSGGYNGNQALAISGDAIWVVSVASNQISLFNKATETVKTYYGYGSVLSVIAVGNNAFLTSTNADTTAYYIVKFTYIEKTSPVLDDDNYRLLLRAAVFQNHWDGQVDSFQTFWSTLIPGGKIIIDDHQDMTVEVILQGQFTQLVQDMIFNGMIVPRPQGVLYTYVFPDLPMFGFDLNTQFIAGFDNGKFV